jgi:hypothetical protein
LRKSLYALAEPYFLPSGSRPPSRQGFFLLPRIFAGQIGENFKNDFFIPPQRAGKIVLKILLAHLNIGGSEMQICRSFFPALRTGKSIPLEMSRGTFFFCFAKHCRATSFLMACWR